MQVAITGIIRFADLDIPVRHPNFPKQDPKFRLQFNTPKENTEVKALLEIVQKVGLQKWGTGDEAEQRFRGVMRTIEEGDNEGTIGLLDGDAYKPEYNAGQYILKGSARSNEKPRFRAKDGSVMEQAPKPGDLVRVLIDVWAMSQHKRINFTILGVRLIEPNFAEVGAPEVTDEAIDAQLEAPEAETLALFSGEALPAIEAGASEEPEPEVKPKRKRGRPRKQKEVAEEPDSPPESEGGTNLFDGL